MYNGCEYLVEVRSVDGNGRESVASAPVRATPVRGYPPCGEAARSFSSRGKAPLLFHFSF